MPPMTHASPIVISTVVSTMTKVRLLPAPVDAADAALELAVNVSVVVEMSLDVSCGRKGPTVSLSGCVVVVAV
jgi:hypothetical protein